MQRVAAAYLKPSNRTLGVFLPTAKPDRAEIPPPVAGRRRVKDYKGDAAIAAGEAFDPSPANIESRTKRSELPDGMKLALLLEEDARRHGRRDDDPALRRREEPRRHSRPPPTSPPTC